MPELPDLQVFAANLTRKLKGKKLHRIGLHHKKKGEPSAEKINEALADHKLHAVYREGKQLYFDFGKERVVAMHLMLHGRLVLATPEDDIPAHTLVLFDFGDALLFLTDFQKMAHISLNPPPPAGLDALSPKLRADWLKEKLSDSKAAIKSLLMDQKIISGIGNAYADEILYDAGIAPESKANKIPSDAVKALAASIRKVLKDAAQHIKEKDPDIISGEIRDFLAVHNSKRKTSPSGAQILVKKAGGRSTYYTGEQKVY